MFQPRQFGYAFQCSRLRVFMFMFRWIVTTAYIWFIPLFLCPLLSTFFPFHFLLSFSSSLFYFFIVLVIFFFISLTVVLLHSFAILLSFSCTYNLKVTVDIDTELFDEKTCQASNSIQCFGYCVWFNFCIRQKEIWEPDS